MLSHTRAVTLDVRREGDVLEIPHRILRVKKLLLSGVEFF